MHPDLQTALAESDTKGLVADGFTTLEQLKGWLRGRGGSARQVDDLAAQFKLKPGDAVDIVTRVMGVPPGVGPLLRTATHRRT